MTDKVESIRIECNLLVQKAKKFADKAHKYSGDLNYVIAELRELNKFLK